MNTKQTISDTIEKEEEKPHEELDTKPTPDVTEPATEPEVDRSAYNCQDCGGEGLIRSLDKVCTACNGTGKV